MKKLISLFLCVFLTFSLISTFAEEAENASDKIEIAFKVGDSTLLINGKEVTVETPYIAGEGTTLVPLRVITEAFGAEVLWEGETKTITLNYPDVTIILQIDNKEAKVNDHTEELSVAPTLSASGVTMVPLRFISETFGADVGYDEGAITVTKAADDFGTTVSTLTQKEKIGDSYYGWTMNTPKNLTLAEKSFDGRSLVFENDDVTLYLDIYPFDKDDSFEQLYISRKNYVSSSGSLVKDEIKEDENKNPYYILRVNKKEYLVDYRYYFTPNGSYSITTYISSNEASVKESILSIIDSFKIEEISDEVFDLSEVKDGMRLYENEELKISIMVPADYTDYDEDTNSFELSYYGEDKEEVYSEVALYINSKTETSSAKSFAESDLATRKAYYNPKYSTLSDSVSEEKIGDLTVYKYTHNRFGFKDYTYTLTDCFFEKGEYIYNFTFMAESKANLDINAVLASIKVEELDPDTFGTVLRSENNPDMIVPIKNDYWTIKAPATWNPSSSGTTANFSSDYADAMISVSSSTGKKYTDTTLKTYAKNTLKELKASSEITVAKDVKSVKINGYSGYSFTIKQSSDEKPAYIGTFYCIYKDNCLVEIAVVYSEIYDSETTQNEINSILNSFEMVKK